MRRLAYLGSFERVDMRNVVGKEDPKFIFFGALDPAKIRRRTLEEVRTAAEQHANGVEVTNDQALAILTSPNAPAGFYDFTEKDPQPATAGDAQAVAPESIGVRVNATPVEAVVYDEPTMVGDVPKPTTATNPDPQGIQPAPTQPKESTATATPKK